MTEKGKYALKIAIEQFKDKEFCAADLSAYSEKKVVAASLNALVNEGFMNKLGGSPVKYSLIEDVEALFENYLEKEENKGCDNSNLHKAKRAKDNEFYTYYKDIEIEVIKYKDSFKDKIVYLPCDDEESAFWTYFNVNFDTFGLKKLIASHSGKAKMFWRDGNGFGEESIENGDFRNPECIKLLEECDIVCTNPPFSLFKEFIPLLFQYNKQFLVIGPLNGTCYKDIFPYIQKNMVWSGYNNVRHFLRPDGSDKSMNNTFWWTNLPRKQSEPLTLTKTYDAEEYKNLAYYDAIFIEKVSDIPNDYFGCMAVPISFFQGKHNTEQFEIIGCTEGDWAEPGGYHYKGEPYGCIKENGEAKFKRLFIRRKD